MKRLVTLIIVISVLSSLFGISVEQFIHDDVVIEFPDEIKFLTYKSKPAFAVDISFYPDTMFLPRTINLNKIFLIVLMLNEDGEIEEVEIKPSFYNSSVLSKLVSIGPGPKVPYDKPDTYKIPDVISALELESKQKENGSLLYYLPEDEPYVIYKLKWGDDFTTFYGENKYVEIYPYSANAIIDVLMDNNIITRNLEILYEIYKMIIVFEDSNESLKETW